MQSGLLNGTGSLLWLILGPAAILDGENNEHNSTFIYLFIFVTKLIYINYTTKLTATVSVYDATDNTILLFHLSNILLVS